MFWLLWAALGLHCWAWIFSSCGKQGLGLLTSCSAWASLVVEHRFQGAQAQDLWLTSLVPWQYVGSSWTTDWTCVSCIGRRIPNHWTTQEVPKEGCLTEKLMKLRFQDLSWARTLPRCCEYIYSHHFFYVFLKKPSNFVRPQIHEVYIFSGYKIAYKRDSIFKMKILISIHNEKFYSKTK